MAFVAACSGRASLIGAVDRRGRLAAVEGGRRLEPAGPGQAVGEGADAVARPPLRVRGEPIVEAPEAQRGLSDVGGGRGGRAVPRSWSGMTGSLASAPSRERCMLVRTKNPASEVM